MPFTEEERRRWREEKRAREPVRELRPSRPPPVAICLHCHQPFGHGEGYIDEEIALCGFCDGD